VARALAAGSPGPTTVKHAEMHGVDPIVMDRRGHGRIAELLLGSVSHRVMRLTDHVCLTIE
jgi:nucleotide-binding universal stress UspA family protein